MNATVSVVPEDHRFQALNAVIESSGRLRPHRATIRRVVEIWIPDEGRVSGLSIEGTLKPIALFLESAPGLQSGEDMILVDEKEIREHMKDVCYKAEIIPCVIKVLQTLKYGPNELYQLGWADFKRLERAIIAVRNELRVAIPSSVHVKTSSEEDRESGLGHAMA